MNEKKELKVEVKDIASMHVAYIRHIGPYKGDTALFARLFGQLMKWAGPRGLLKFPETKVMAVYHDNPDITDESKLRTSACITHCTSTTIASTAPVRMASSYCRKFPAAGMPCRIRISLAVQQIPERFTPSAPASRS